MRKVVRERCTIEFDLYTDGSRYRKLSTADEVIFNEKLKILLKEYVGSNFEVLDLDYKFERNGQDSSIHKL